MDHLPKGSTRNLEIEIPYLFDHTCPYVYDNIGFATYPERCGWELKEFYSDRADLTHGGQRSAYQVGSYLQAWLFFGFLGLFLESNGSRSEIRTNSFLRKSSFDQFIIATEQLPKHVILWSLRMKVLPEQERKKKIEDLDDSLKHTQPIYRQALRSGILPAEVVLSIVILQKTLYSAKLWIFPGSYDEQEVWPSPARDLVILPMLEDGWCKSEILMLSQGLSSLGMCYLRSLGPRSKRRNHADCSDTKCLALQIDESRYEFQHAQPGCRCDSVSADINRMSSIIQDGRTPLVTVSKRPGSGRFELVIQPKPRDAPYVVISHLWSDRLGNAKENSLPICQLKLLQKRVNALYGIHDICSDKNIPFWMDTLCVPVTQEYNTIRKFAIKSMATYYQQAEKALILDGELMDTACDTSNEEVCMRVSTANWWRRLWTLQEGLLPKELWFQFNDRAIELESLLECNGVPSLSLPSSSSLPSSFNAQQWSMDNAIQKEASDRLHRFIDFRKAVAIDRIRYIWEGFHYRSTSKEGDEAACLCTLFGVDIASSLASENPSIKHFIKLQKSFPAITIFASSQNRIMEDGLHWAPRSFVLGPVATKSYLSDRNARYDPSVPLGLADNSGLHVQYPGFRLMMGGTLDDMVLHLPFVDETEGAFSTITIASTGQLLWGNVKPHKMPHLALVLPRRPWISDTLSDSVVPGILVQVTSEAHDTLFATFIYDVVVALRRKFEVEQMNSQKGGTSMYRTFGQGVALDEQQKWCIG
ncbi:MAG: hypothetical protein M1827_006366 [Pycnora praestabilis]|nr:MAG: hypothetical protein M1827_006366 [Pycnora praestabilis]